MKILHLGAGKIGRGLIFPFFRDLHDITLADRNAGLVQSIRNNGGYSLIELDYGEACVRKIQAPAIKTFPELAGIDDWDVITTSVLVTNLPDLAILIRQLAENNKRPLYIVPMENSPQAVYLIKDEVVDKLPRRGGVFVLGSVIDRIVPSIRNGLDVECEKYFSVLIEDRHGFGTLAGDQNLVTETIEREFDKKFLLVNGVHACAAYLGHRQGYHYICDVMADSVTRRKLDLVGRCYIQYLTAVYGFQEAELASYLVKTMTRFANPSIKDPLHRVGRNLCIKLSPTDRIVRPLLFNKHRGLDYKPLQEVIEAAQHFTIASDHAEYMSSPASAKTSAVGHGLTAGS